MIPYSHRGEGMSFPKLKSGQKILINTGYTIIEAVVEHVRKGMVFPVDHKCFVRCDCYAIPGELDRLPIDLKIFAEHAERIIAKAKEGL